MRELAMLHLAPLSSALFLLQSELDLLPMSKHGLVVFNLPQSALLRPQYQQFKILQQLLLEAIMRRRRRPMMTLRRTMVLQWRSNLQRSEIADSELCGFSSSKSLLRHM